MGRRLTPFPVSWQSKSVSTPQGGWACGKRQRSGSAGQHSNPNIEARNSKQYQMTEIQMAKTKILLETYQP